MTIQNAVLSLPSELAVAASLNDPEELSTLLAQQRQTEEELAALEMELQFFRHSALRNATVELITSGQFENHAGHSLNNEKSLTPSAILRRCRLARATTSSYTSHLTLCLARTAPESVMALLDQLVARIEIGNLRLMEIEQKICTYRPDDLRSIRKLLEYIASALLAGDAEVDLFAWMISDCAERIAEIDSEIKNSP